MKIIDVGKIPVAQFKAHWWKIMEEARGGKSFILTNHGKSKVIVKPLDGKEDSTLLHVELEA